MYAEVRRGSALKSADLASIWFCCGDLKHLSCTYSSSKVTWNPTNIVHLSWLDTP